MLIISYKFFNNIIKIYKIIKVINFIFYLSIAGFISFIKKIYIILKATDINKSNKRKLVKFFYNI